jgi:GntR family transcriptional regulator
MLFLVIMSDRLVSALPQPLYRQLKELLRAAILDGTFATNEKLPSESELGLRYSVSRITVRQAIGDLHKEGLVFRIQGKGTYVSKPRATEPLSSLQGFSEAMRQLGYETHSKLLSVLTLNAESSVANALAIAERSPVTEIRRVRYLNREPISLDISYFRPDLGERLNAEDIASRDIFPILENECGLALGHADLSIEATLADENSGPPLGLASGAPVMRIERLTYSEKDLPIEYEHLYYRGDAFRYHVRVDRVAHQLNVGAPGLATGRAAARASM